jgi:lactoylglutathione lyase
MELACRLRDGFRPRVGGFPFADEAGEVIRRLMANTDIHRWQAGGAVTIRIEHVALWTGDLGRCKAFYTGYFGATAGEDYVNSAKGFRSCFLSFAEGARIEVMATTTLSPVALEPGAQRMGLTHFAIAVGSTMRVDALTNQLRQDGFAILDGPRRTGDGYYESVVLDPDGNRVEICF